MKGKQTAHIEFASEKRCAIHPCCTLELEAQAPEHGIQVPGHDGYPGIEWMLGVRLRQAESEGECAVVIGSEAVVSGAYRPPVFQSLLITDSERLQFSVVQHVVYLGGDYGCAVRAICNAGPPVGRLLGDRDVVNTHFRLVHILHK